MLLEDIILKNIIDTNKNLKGLDCMTLRSQIIKIEKGILKMGNYRTAILLNKIINETECESVMNEIIITIYEKLQNTLYIPKSHQILFTRLKKFISERTIFKKNEVIDMIKYLYYLYPNYISFNTIILLKYSKCDNFVLCDHLQSWAHEGIKFSLLNCNYIFIDDENAEENNTISFCCNKENDEEDEEEENEEDEEEESIFTLLEKCTESEKLLLLEQSTLKGFNFKKKGKSNDFAFKKFPKKI